LARVDGMYSVVVSIFEFVVKICQRLSKREREREREIGYIQPKRPLLCKIANLKGLRASPPHQCSVQTKIG
jgi:hypothetical protein